MKAIVISKNTLLLSIATWWLVVVVLAGTGWNPFGVLWVLGVPLMVLLPGALSLLPVSLGSVSGWSRALLVLGVSLLELMVVGLLSNFFLPLIGVERPLDTLPVVVVLSVLLLLLFAGTWRRVRAVSVVLPKYLIAHTRLDALFLVMPVVFVLLSVLGALRLNNGMGNGVTLFMLFSVAVYSVVFLHYAPRLSRSVAPTALFCIALALLLMTSLRGWYISGHDIQREFFVFQLAKDAGLWSVATYRDAYNACLSITILPTMLANMLHIADAYVYKVVYQILFAGSVVLAFLLARKWVSLPVAYLASFLFVSFPTFFQDMPFLVRQEIAFLFLGLMLYFLFEERLSIRLRRVLFVLFGVGVVLSHYSTTYTVLFVFALAPVLTAFVAYVLRMRVWQRWLGNTALLLPPRGTPVPRRLTFGMVLLLVCVSVLWTFVITDTDGHMRQVSSEIVAAVRGGTDGETHSVDVLSIFAFDRVQTEVTLDTYIETTVMERRTASPDEFYATSTYATFPRVTLVTTELPVTPLGASVEVGGVSTGDLVTFFGRLIAKIMQVAILVGLLYVVFRAQFMRNVDLEFFVLAGGSVLFVVMCIVLPMLSKEYGVFRALQQSLFVLAPFAVVGMLATGWWFGALYERWLRLLSFGQAKTGTREAHAFVAATLLGTLFFLYTTGFMTQLVGGNLPAIHLNTVGDDYKHYVTERSEYQAIQWLKQELHREYHETARYPIVQSDRFGEKKLRGYLASQVGGDIFPGVVHKDGYVFITPAIQYSGTAFVNYEGTTLKFAYPLTFLEEQKDLVYTNGDVLIYR